MRRGAGPLLALALLAGCVSLPKPHALANASLEERRAAYQAGLLTVDGSEQSFRVGTGPERPISQLKGYLLEQGDDVSAPFAAYKPWSLALGTLSGILGAAGIGGGIAMMGNSGGGGYQGWGVLYILMGTPLAYASWSNFRDARPQPWVAVQSYNSRLGQSLKLY
jgi:hypothetical protein